MPMEGLRKMVETDLRRRDVRDERVLAAFLKIDRALFVPLTSQDDPYGDRPLPLPEGQTISQPYMVALMLQALKLGGDEKILEIGTGSGYQTALLAELGKEVFTVERIGHLASGAEEALRRMGFQNIHYRLGDGSLGWPEAAPFDRIIVSAASPRIPEALAGQLNEGGILVIPVGPASGQELIVATRQAGRLQIEKSVPCIFVRLIGSQGFKNFLDPG